MTLPNGFTIHSGGQTGVDRAALNFAIHNGIPHGGWCPCGRLAEDGPLSTMYELVETVSDRNDQRTRWNVRDTDATLLLSIEPQLTGGSRLTAEIAQEMRKPWLHISRSRCPFAVEAGQRVRGFIDAHQVRRLNVAGPRESQEPEVGDFVQAVLVEALLKSSG